MPDLSPASLFHLALFTLALQLLIHESALNRFLARHRKGATPEQLRIARSSRRRITP